jgi:dCTP deaminase
MNCPTCNNRVIQPKKKQGGGLKSVYCSEKCRQKAKRKRPASRAYQRQWAQAKNDAQRRDGTRRDYFLRLRHGITEAEWESLFDKQGRRCAICRIDKSRSRIGWHTDHDHATKKIRGILCENCNRGLGMYADDISFLRRAAAYLGIHQGVLGGNSIVKAGAINPPMERTIQNGLTFGAGCAGYDIRIDQTMNLEPREFKLASSIEYFDMPHDVCGMVCDKSSHARRGLSAFNTIIEPGWRGYLTLELVNLGNDLIKLSHGDPIAQVIFHSLDQPTNQPYTGKYQDQPRGPQPVKYE